MSPRDELPCIKQREIKPCALCGRGLAHDGNFLFWRLRFDRLGFDRTAIDRQHGLELMLQSPRLALIMSPDRDIAKIIDGGHEALVCEPCVMEKLIGLLLIAEARNEQAEIQERAGSSIMSAPEASPSGGEVSNPTPAPDLDQDGRNG